MIMKFGKDSGTLIPGIYTNSTLNQEENMLKYKYELQ